MPQVLDDSIIEEVDYARMREETMIMLIDDFLEIYDEMDLAAFLKYASEQGVEVVFRPSIKVYQGKDYKTAR